MVAGPFSLTNLICNDSLTKTHMEFAGVKLVVANPETLSSDHPATRVKPPYESIISCGHESFCIDTPPSDIKIIYAEESGYGRDGVILSKVVDNNEGSIPSKPMNQENENKDDLASLGDTQSVISDSGSLCCQEFIASGSNSSTAMGWESKRDSLQVNDKFILAEVNLRSKAMAMDVEGGCHKADSSSSSSSPSLSSEMPQAKSRAGGHNLLELNNIPLWGFTSICGKRTEMEDAVATVPRFLQVPTQMLKGTLGFSGIDQNLSIHFFGVYDGHGGSQVANYCRERMHLVLAEEIENAKAGVCSGDSWQDKWREAFSKCFVKVDAEIGGVSGSNPSVAPETVGSTAVVAIVAPTHIIVGNCGDSRAVLCRGKVAMPLSVDHKPDREDEFARIEAAGGKIIQWNGSRVFGVLAMSRAIGDRYLKPWIIPDPEVTFISRAKEDECLILASDGLWDVMTNEEVCDIARKRILVWHKKYGGTLPAERGDGGDPAAQAAADYLSNLALHKGSKDNISVVVADLKPRRKFKPKPLH